MPKSFVDSLKRWFGRAGALPLVLALTFGEDTFESPVGNGFILHRFLTDCQSWVHLTLIRTSRNESPWTWLGKLIMAVVQKYEREKTPCWPRLEHLWIWSSLSRLGHPRLSRTGFPLQKIAPRIRSLEAIFQWQDVTSNIIFSSKNVPWMQLTDFQCGPVVELKNRPAFIFQILISAPYLKRLGVGMFDGKDEEESLNFDPTSIYAVASFRIPPPSSFDSRVIHLDLRYVHLHLPWDAMMLLLDRIRLPSIRLFDYRTFSHSRSSFIALQAASRDPLFWPNLHTFRYDGGRVSFKLCDEWDGQTAFHYFTRQPLNWWDSHKYTIIPYDEFHDEFPL
jgi:hypothetical protein